MKFRKFLRKIKNFFILEPLLCRIGTFMSTFVRYFLNKKCGHILKRARGTGHHTNLLG